MSEPIASAAHPLGFSPLEDAPVRYLERTRAWYERIGTHNPYRWASHAEVPFTPLPRPLAQCTVALLTTAVVYDSAKGPQDARAGYNPAAKFYAVYSGDTSQPQDTRVMHVAVNRRELGDDPNAWFPLPALHRAQAAGRIGAVARRFHGVPTNRSQRHTLAADCPEVLARCREDGVDAAVLVANCPVCHQTLSLAARTLEAAGIATVILGAAKDVVELCGVPRFVFSDFPLGHAAGRPNDAASQDYTLALALDLLERAFAPRTTVQNPLRWTGRADWKHFAFNVDALTLDELAQERATFFADKTTAHAVRDATIGRTR